MIEIFGPKNPEKLQVGHFTDLLSYFVTDCTISSVINDCKLLYLFHIDAEDQFIDLWLPCLANDDLFVSFLLARCVSEEIVPTELFFLA